REDGAPRSTAVALRFPTTKGRRAGRRAGQTAVRLKGNSPFTQYGKQLTDWATGTGAPAHPAAARGDGACAHADRTRLRGVRLMARDATPRCAGRCLPPGADCGARVYARNRSGGIDS